MQVFENWEADNGEKNACGAEGEEKPPQSSPEAGEAAGGGHRDSERRGHDEGEGQILIGRHLQKQGVEENQADGPSVNCAEQRGLVEQERQGEEHAGPENAVTREGEEGPGVAGAEGGSKNRFVWLYFRSSQYIDFGLTGEDLGRRHDWGSAGQRAIFAAVYFANYAGEKRLIRRGGVVFSRDVHG